ncbi:hypothetical protein ElyMa_001430100 [Elysia marginata]|uniref:Uncharacterized protein n=1 Tax=Elysia marginata TaxID=1093978 RepID=A0AAV4IZS9_9GAST|nr:hypothetical protein ElyMa_001430100 [Elysia marginata]
MGVSRPSRIWISLLCFVALAMFAVYTNRFRPLNAFSPADIDGEDARKIRQSWIKNLKEKIVASLEKNLKNEVNYTVRNESLKKVSEKAPKSETLEDQPQRQVEISECPAKPRDLGKGL